MQCPLLDMTGTGTVLPCNKYLPAAACGSGSVLACGNSSVRAEKDSSLAWRLSGPTGVEARPWVDCREVVRSEAAEVARVAMAGPLPLLVLLRSRLATSSMMICASSPVPQQALVNRCSML